MHKTSIYGITATMTIGVGIITVGYGVDKPQQPTDPTKDFIPNSALESDIQEHPRLPEKSLINPSLGSASTFENIKPEYISASCVACHVNRGCDLTPPPLKTEDGKPGAAYYLGGKGGTVFNATSKAFEQEAPAVTEAGLSHRFRAGETFFEGNFSSDNRKRFGGLGPTYIKSSCLACHPGYGRGQRTDRFDKQYGNGYLAFVHNPDGTPVKGYTAMLQTKAVPPFVPYAKGVKIEWHDFVDQYGNKYPDGTPYNAGKTTEGTLTYPTADVIDPLLPLPKDYRVSIESTIGIFGTGLLDALKDEDIIAEYNRQQSITGPVKGSHGKWIKEADGKLHLGKFTWDCSRATLDNGPGVNALWNVTNVTRKDRPNIYMTSEWLEKQKELGIDVSGLEKKQAEEMSMKDYEDFMVWHRGLAVPAARNLDKPDVQSGQKLFNKLGCAGCHKPEWKTGDYPALPGFSNQTIRPYTDMLRHDMGEINRGRSSRWRTPPLWGRGLMLKAANHTDMFHDLRARDFEEAILWHFGEGEFSREMFRHLSARERNQLIEFLKSL